MNSLSCSTSPASISLANTKTLGRSAVPAVAKRDVACFANQLTAHGQGRSRRTGVAILAQPNSTCPCCGCNLEVDCCTSSSTSRWQRFSHLPTLRGQRQTCRAVEVDSNVATLGPSSSDSVRKADISIASGPLERDYVPPHLDDLEHPPETGVLPEEHLRQLSSRHEAKSAVSAAATAARDPSFRYNQEERNQIRESWDALMRWSKVFRTRKDVSSPIESTKKVVVFGGGSFGTAIGCQLAEQKQDMDVVLLLRDPYLCKDINGQHCNTRYLQDFKLPPNVRATTSPTEAINGAQFAVHAVPVQSSRAFLVGVKDILPPTVPIICVSKGLELATGQMMSDLIPSALERKQPAVFVSGPSFAKEVMQHRPTGLVAACKDQKLARTVQALFASQTMRVNTTSDVVGVEICGALKNVLAIAAGIAEGLDLGNNAMAALIAQGCAEIRWLAEKMGAKSTTLSGLSGLGDIMLTCYGSLSRNRSVGIRLGKGEKLADIIASSSQVAEGVATAGVVVSLARTYRVSLPVLTAVAQVLDGNLTPREAVHHIMNLPQIEES